MAPRICSRDGEPGVTATYLDQERVQPPTTPAASGRQDNHRCCSLTLISQWRPEVVSMATYSRLRITGHLYHFPRQKIPSPCHGRDLTLITSASAGTSTSGQKNVDHVPDLQPPWVLGNVCFSCPGCTGRRQTGSYTEASNYTCATIHDTRVSFIWHGFSKTQRKHISTMEDSAENPTADWEGFQKERTENQERKKYRRLISQHKGQEFPY